jgi:hypothetical protein
LREGGEQGGEQGEGGKAAEGRHDVGVISRWLARAGG